MSKTLRRVLFSLLALFLVLGVASVAGFFWVTSGIGITKANPDADQRDEAVYLVMIRDTRAGGNAELLKSGDASASDVGRTDAMVLARVLPDESIDLVSIPRDTVVDIPACERSDGSKSEPAHTKINAAYAYGASAVVNESASEAGMQCASRTVSMMTGLTLGGSIVLDSKGVEGVVDKLGGVKLCATAEQAAAIPGMPEGCNVVDGQTAFDFSRARDGVDDGSDLARIERQQQLLQAVATELRGLSIPGDVPTLLSMSHDLGSHVTATKGVISLGNASMVLSTLKKGKIQTETVPVNLTADGNNVVVSESAKAWWRALAEGAPLPTK
ncbi:LCP family protein [Corynebacterium gerontici]|uniref:Transcriptional regulator YwtF n=1 Tax=Corynebacterium gerontici TaxID=2079234 RepID=A0A3G6IXM6_9CORY|nr:LCP family protein [Corynebacterium gerontici]AZA10442.1 Putative transcriptional regulator YwtF [Corynebacterium gerontici]